MWFTRARQEGSVGAWGGGGDVHWGSRVGYVHSRVSD